MNNQERVDNLKLMYTMCLKELQAAKNNLELCFKKANETTTIVLEEIGKSQQNHQNKMYLIAYDKAISDLTEIANLIRKFNVKCELTTQRDEIQRDVHNISFPITNAIKYIDDEDEPKPNRFTFTEPNIDKFKVHQVEECIVTHVQDAFEKLLYIIDPKNQEQKHCYEYLVNYLHNNPQKLDHFPKEGEIFGIEDDNCIFRVVRENYDYNENFENSINVLLIDTGEIFSINLNTTTLYLIPNELKTHPAQAILCKLETVPYSHINNVSAYLDEKLHERQKFIIVRKERSLLYINFIDDTNPFMNGFEDIESIDKESHLELSTNQNTITKINPFQPFFYGNSTSNNIESDVNIGTKINRRNKKHNSHIASFTSNYGTNTYDNANELINSTTVSEKRYNEVSKEELEILNEEPLNTTNALKAVLGYVPKDDGRICRFYNSKTGACFKGSRCKKEHVKKLEDGWTRDEAETVIDISNKIVYPSVGSTVIIIPTCIQDVEFFYAHLCDKESKNKSGLRKLTFEMNSDIQQSKYSPLDSLPVKFQLVLAVFRDCFWYRGRIVDIVNDYKVKVFFVDVGETHTINIDKVRKWESKFEYLPFQAIKCQIVGIKRDKEKWSLLKAVEKIEKLILNRPLEAKLVDIIESDILLIDLCDEDGFNNIGEQLIKMGFAKEKNAPYISSSRKIPA